MTQPPSPDDQIGKQRFRRNLFRVMTVQVVSLIVLWLVQQRTKNAGIVDVGWALSFVLVVGLFSWRATAWTALPILTVLGAVMLVAFFVMLSIAVRLAIG